MAENDLFPMTPAEVLEEFFAKKQVTLQVTISLDSLPGWGFYGEDYLKLVQDLVNDSIGHYKPVVTMIKNDRPIPNVAEFPRNPDCFACSHPGMGYTHTKE